MTDFFLFSLQVYICVLFTVLGFCSGQNMVAYTWQHSRLCIVAAFFNYRIPHIFFIGGLVYMKLA